MNGQEIVAILILIAIIIYLLSYLRRKERQEVLK
jgi:H+/gluconate symporter-like permease